MSLKITSIEKSHHNDAFVIAGGSNQVRAKTQAIEQIRRHKRSMEQFYDAKYLDTRTSKKASLEIKVTILKI